MSDYNKQATDFLESTGTELEWKLESFGSHLPADEYCRLVYEWKLTRGERSITGKFGESLAVSFERVMGKPYPHTNLCVADHKEYERRGLSFRRHARKTLPNAYDLLSCLQKYEVEPIDDWCAENGIELGLGLKISDIIAMHEACTKEYEGLCRLFSDAELDQLREIQ